MVFGKHNKPESAGVHSQQSLVGFINKEMEWEKLEWRSCQVCHRSLIFHAPEERQRPASLAGRHACTHECMSQLNLKAWWVGTKMMLDDERD